MSTPIDLAPAPADRSSHRPTVVGSDVPGKPAAHDILLVEDETSLRTLLGHFLEHAGYRVHQVASGREAVEYLKVQEARLILTDIFMPEGDGIELLNALRKARQPIPIIAMSGSVNCDPELFLSVARHLGARTTLSKPFALQDLLGAVQACLGCPH